MLSVHDALYQIHRLQAARQGLSPLAYTEFCCRLGCQSDTDLTQLLAPAQVPLSSWTVPVFVKRTPKPRFELGQLRITPAAAMAIPHQEVLHALRRHARGDWGQLDPADRCENERALRQGGRVLSVFLARSGQRFYVITEPGHEVTTVLLPEDY